jgi:hypothetical protein
MLGCSVVRAGTLDIGIIGCGYPGPQNLHELAWAPPWDGTLRYIEVKPVTGGSWSWFSGYLGASGTDKLTVADNYKKYRIQDCTESSPAMWMKS